MKLRKLAVALALIGGLGSSGLALALGLGEANISSNLNEPLRAEIDLVSVGDVGLSDIAAHLAPPKDFSRAGVERAPFLADLQFRVVRNQRGRAVVEISSRKPVREPFLNFLVELNWPSGRLLREYSVLVDPPLYSAGQSVAAAVPRSEPAPSSSYRRAPAEASSASRRPGPAADSYNSGGQPGSYGPVRSDDTLWGIALRTKASPGITAQQQMLAIRDLNPEAFRDGNINRLSKGAILRLPDAEQAQSRTARQAFAEVNAQTRTAAKPTGAPVNATAQKDVAPAPSTPAPASAASGDELKLLVADKAAQDGKGSHGGAEGGSGASAENRLSMTLEQLDKSKRDNSELNARVHQLEEQLSTLKRLAELKDDQLSQLQEQMGSLPTRTELPVPSGTTATAEPVVDGMPLPVEAPAPSVPAPDVVSVPPGANPLASDLPETEGAVTAPDAVPPQPEIQAVMTPDAGASASTPVAPDSASAPAEKLDILHLLKTNIWYQIGAGGSALLLLIVLGLIARRNASHEKRFYDELNRSNLAAEKDDHIDLSAGSDSVGALGVQAAGTTPLFSAAARSAMDDLAPEVDDPITEADTYIAYGRLDQASSILELAVSREPSRTDIRLKLLEVYQGLGNQQAFERQYRELAAMDDEPSLRAADAMRSTQDAGLPSMGDLESELKSSRPSATAAATGAAAAGVGKGSYIVERGSSSVESELTPLADAESIDFDLTGIDLGAMKKTGLPDASPATGSSAANPAEDDLEWAGNFDLDLPDLPSMDVSSALDEESLNIELQGLLSDSDAEALEPESLSGDDASLDLSDLELDESFESANVDDVFGKTVSIEKAPSFSAATEQPDVRGVVADDLSDGMDDEDLSAISEEDFDESFLADLDAEFDKVASETAAEGDEQSLASALAALDGGAAPLSESVASVVLDAPLGELDELELDVSVDDLALMGEVAASAGDSEVADDELDFPDGLSAEISVDGVPDEDRVLSGITQVPATDWSLDADALDDGLLLPDDELLLPDADDVLPAAVDISEESAFDGDLDLVSDGDLDLVSDDEFSAEDLASFEEAELVEDDIDDSVLDVVESSMFAEGPVDSGSLGEGDDFDFLAGENEAETKLDLARAYIEMGDGEGARDILEEVVLEGSDQQKRDAQELLKKMS